MSFRQDDISVRRSKLSATKRALLEMRLRGEAPSAARAQLIPRREVQSPVPLSFAQQRLWLIDQLDPGSPLYNIPTALRLRGQLNVKALEYTLKEIVRRHEVLRTRFVSIDEQPVQLIASETDLHFSVIDLRGMPQAESKAEAQRLIAEETCQPFDLSSGPLLRVSLLRLEEDEQIVVVTMHHIISDGWSMGVFVREVVTLYEAYAAGEVSPLPELTIQYADYAVWQRQWLQGEVLEQQLDYWRTQLAGAPAVLELPTDHPRPAVQSFHGAQHSLSFRASLSQSLKALSQREGVTLFMTLLAAFQTLLARYSGQDEIMVGTPIAGRTRAEIEPLIGFFVNTLVLRASLKADFSFLHLLRQVRELTLAAYAHQDLPFEKLVEELRLERSLSHQPLFQVMFVLQNAPRGATPVGGLKLKPEQVKTGSAAYDLTLSMMEAGEVLGASLEYSTDLFEPESIERMVGHFQRLLEGVVADPERRVSELPLLSEAELHQLLFEWNDTNAPFPAESCIHELFEAQVELTPDAVAVIYEDEQLSYRELNARANQLAHYLRSFGVGPESLVGILLERSPEMIVSLLGVLKAGAAYVPLDPAYPAERLSLMIEDAGVEVLLTEAALRPELRTPAGTRRLYLGAERHQVEAQSGENPAVDLSAHNLAYVIYTSGSTGRPKGVCISHHSLVNYTSAVAPHFHLQPTDRVLQFAPLGFDVLVEELFPCLTSGGCLVLRPDHPLSVAEFRELLERQRITWLEVPAAFWHQWVAELVETRERLPDSLRLVIVGSEKPQLERVREWQERTGKDLIYIFGLTETTVTNTLYHVRADRELGARVSVLPIGSPVANAQVYVLDKEMQPVGVGISGELYIGGEGLARGYLNRAEWTAERFIPDGWSGKRGERLYRTGDVVRWVGGGELEFIGRKDEQVKVRGYRIELGEVEAALREEAGVAEAVVAAVAEGEGGEKRLVAYVVSAAETEVEARELRQRLKERLPEYMIPSAFVLLGELPLTPNGKVDRRALPAPELAREEIGGVDGGPRGVVEEMVAAIFAGVLKLERAGRHENFFALGGHSLLATQVVSRVRQAFRVELPLRELFERPTISGLAEAIEAALRSELGEKPPPLKPVPREAALPLSFAQQRLWFIDRLEPGTDNYNTSTAARLTGPLNVLALEQTLDEIARRHETLRTTFTLLNGQPAQIIAPASAVMLMIVDVSELTSEERETEARRLIRAEARRPFDLSSGPLLRVQLIKLGEEEHVLLFTMHHIISDGWSMGVLVKELATFYEAFSSGRPSPLPELTIQYADYAVWQREWLQGEALEQELSYWKGQLAGAQAVLELPTDHPRPAVQSFHGAQHSLSIAANLSHSLKALSQREGVTLFMTLLAAFQSLLARYSGQDEIVVGTPIAGRTRAEVEPLIGFFINTLVLRSDLAGDPTFSELLRQVREVSLGAYAHQDLPFEKLVEELRPERDMSRSPLFQVMFAFEHAPAQAVEVPALSLRPIGVENRTAKFDLSLSMMEAGELLGASLEYSTDLFEPESIERMVSHFQRLLEGIVADPERRVSELPLLSEAELHQLLFEWNGTKAAYPAESCIHQLFEAQVERTPDAIAVIYEDEQLSYRELNRRANQLAHHLRSLGVGVESLVGILLERSLEMVISLLGVLKAGAAYVPLDPAYPAERLSFMVEDAKLSLLLTEAELAGEMRLPARTKMVCLGAEQQLWAAQSGGNLSVRMSPSNLAYVIYTSGSTGRPKGVLIAHRALVNHSTRMAEYYCLQGTDRVLQFASLSFDVAAEELFPTWLSGATVVFQEKRALASLRDFLSFVERGKLSVINLPTPYWHELVAELPRSKIPLPSQLRLVIIGSDQALPEYLGLWRKHVGERVRWINAYGPTEAAITATTYEPARAHSTSKIHNVPIGRPIANKQVYLLDKHLNPVPVGVVGELYIGGEGLARGYLNRPEMSAERFIPNPFNDGDWMRLYRTGDMGRRLPDGNIELHGRSDQQVKIRGYRIELGEVEAALTEHPDVRGAAAAVRKGAHGDKRLVAYLVAAREKPAVSEVRKFLRERLPEHMIPSAFVMLDALPLTLNGKVDRQALPAPDMDRPALTGAYVGPHTEMERRLAEVWQEVLQVKNVGVHDNFFDLGGHSLSLIQVQVRLQELLKRDVHVVELFRQPTISSLAMYLGQTSNERSLVQESYERAETRRSLRKRKRQFRPADDVKPRL